MPWSIGSMAVIGRAAAVSEIARLRFHGFWAWLVWLFIHVINLVEHENRILVCIQRGWNDVKRNRSARLIAGETTDQEHSKPQVEVRSSDIDETEVDGRRLSVPVGAAGSQLTGMLE